MTGDQVAWRGDARHPELIMPDSGLVSEGAGLRPAQPRGPPGLPQWQRRLVPDQRPRPRDRSGDRLSHGREPEIER